MLLLACTAPKVPEEESADSPAVESAETAETEHSEAESTVETSPDTPGETQETVETADSGDTGEPPGVGIPLPDLRGYSVLYLHVDTLRRDHLAHYGYTRDTLPTVGALPWLVVDGAYADSSWTLPSTSSILTATAQVDHGLRDIRVRAALDYLKLDVPTVAGHLSTQGWATAVFEGNPWLGEFTNMTAEFDVSENHSKSPHIPNLQQLVGHASEWLAKVPAEQPFLIWLQPMDMHLPYQISKEHQLTFGDGDRSWDLASFDEVAQTRQIESALATDPEGARQDLKDTYDEALLDLDQGIAQALAMLEAAGRLETTVVVVSADHGETLDDTENAYIGHGATLRQELIRNPLLFLVPGGKGGEVDCNWQNMDAWPTLLDALGLPPLKTARGTSRLGDCRDIVVSSLWSSEDQPGWIVATDGSEKLQRFCDGTGEVGWNLILDPEELTHLVPSTLSRVDELRAAIDAMVADVAARLPKATCPA